MLDEKEKTTLADWIDYAVRFEGNVRAIRPGMVAAVMSDAALLAELLEVDEGVVWDKIVARAKARAAELRSGGDQTRSVEMIGGSLSPPSADRLPVKFVAAYAQRNPPSKKRCPPIPIEAVMRAKSAVMQIDGDDLRKWTIGRCKSAARTRGHEARVLERISRECAHLEDTQEIGQIYADQALGKLVEECRAS